MAVDWGLVGRDALLLSVCACAATLALAAPFHRLTLRRLAGAVRAGQMTPEGARAKYASHLVMLSRGNVALLLALLVLLVSFGPFQGDFAGSAPGSRAAVTAGVVALVVVVWQAVTILLVTAYRTTAAYALLSGRQVERAALLASTGKALLARSVAALALVEAACLLAEVGQFGPIWLIWLIPLAVCLGLLVHSVVAPYEQRWFVHATPLARTPWAPLAARIDAWARRANVRVGDVWVLDTERLGTVGEKACGALRPTIFLSDAFLRATDWRQQDAMIGVLLSKLRQRHMLTLANCADAIWWSLLWVWLFFIAFSYYTSTLAHPGKHVDSHALKLASVLLVLLTAVGTRVAIYNLIAGYTDPWFARRRYRFSARLTGDPLATMVALHSLAELRGHQPVDEEHLEELERLRWRPGPWAPWTTATVPSAIPLAHAGRILTAPLESAPPREAVPTAPYPVRDPHATLAV